jgi:biotin--protein ligase
MLRTYSIYGLFRPNSPYLSALGLRFSLQRANPSLQIQILPQFLLARPDSWHVQHHVVETLRDHSAVGDESQRKWEPFVFEDANDDFHVHFPSFLPEPEDRTTNHPTFKFIPPNSLSNPKVKHILVPSKSLTSEDERTQFSPSAFFRAIDKFRSVTEDINPDSWRIGEALIYGEVVSSTQTILTSASHQSRLSHHPLRLSE